MALDLVQLRHDVSWTLGYGSNMEALTEGQRFAVDACIRHGAIERANRGNEPELTVTRMVTFGRKWVGPQEQAKES